MKNFLKALGFILTFCFLFFCVSENIFKTRNSVADYIYNFAPKDSIDLLFIGSSHSYCAFNTKVFDNYLGINSYNLGTHSQSIQGSYYMVKEILKKQTPKIIILEAYSLIKEKDDNTVSYMNTRNIYDEMKFSLNKLALANESFPKKDILFLTFNTTTYHEKWKNFKETIPNFNFKTVEPDYKGFLGKNLNNIRGTLNYELYEKEYKNKYNESFPERNIELLEELAQFLKSKNIKLIIVSTPVIPRDSILKGKYCFETNENIKKIIEKYNIDVINFNDGNLKLEKIQFLDDVHVSLAGSDLISERTAEILKEKYLKYFNNRRNKIGKSSEYYFYNKNAQKNDGNFNEYNIKTKFENGIESDKVILYRKGKEIFEVFFKVSFEKDIYSYTSSKEETQVELFGKKIKFKEYLVNDKLYKYLLYPKYYIRKINGEYYIYVKDFKVEESKLPINK